MTDFENAVPVYLNGLCARFADLGRDPAVLYPHQGLPIISGCAYMGLIISQLKKDRAA